MRCTDGGRDEVGRVDGDEPGTPHDVDERAVLGPVGLDGGEPRDRGILHGGRGVDELLPERDQLREIVTRSGQGLGIGEARRERHQASGHRRVGRVTSAEPTGSTPLLDVHGSPFP